MEDLCRRIEAFFAALSESGAVDVYAEELEPSSAEDIAALEAGLGVTLPADVKAWLARGCRTYVGSVDEPFAGIGFSFLAASRALEHTKMLREAAAASGEHADLVRSGVALSYEEPELLWAPSGVYSFSFRNPIHKVASSFTELLEGWLASGCFSSHDFEAAWEKTRAFVPEGSVSPDKNPWVVAYRALHDADG